MPSNAPQRRRVVITGLGVICPLGNNVDQLWQALSNGQSGVVPFTLFPPVENRILYGGECPEFTGQIDNFGPLEKDVKKAIRKALKMMCRETMMAVAAAQHAVTDAGLGNHELSAERCGVVFGSDYMLSPPDDFVDGMIKCGAAEGKFDYSRWGQDGLGQMNPLWMLKYLPNMPGSHIAIFNDFQGPNNSLTMREVSGTMSIREAMQTIQRDHADVIIAGATGTRIHPFKTVHALQTEQIASAEIDPAVASRPFDAERTGMVVGEGAGAVILEELEAARRRGATIYGEIVGSGSSMVANGSSKGRPREALANAARSALAEAGVSSKELGHINAHGLSTQHADIDEASAIIEALGEEGKRIPVVAAKSYFGNLGAGSAVVELAASAYALNKGNLFASLNYEHPDPHCPLNLVTDSSQETGECFLKLSITPQSQAAALVVSRCE